MGGEVRIKMSWVEKNRKVNNWNGRLFGTREYKFMKVFIWQKKV